MPLVFDDPAQFARGGFHDEQAALRALAPSSEPRNATEEFLFAVARSAQSAEQRVHEACASYRSPVDYGLVRFGLERVAALIAAGFGTRIFYVSYPRNAFDTHVYQADTHARLLTYVSDHIAAFMLDMKRLGRDDDVTMMVLGGTGRRVGECQFGHRSRDGRTGVRYRLPGSRGLLRRYAEPDSPRRRQFALYDGFPPCLRDPHHTVDGTGRTPALYSDSRSPRSTC